MEDNQEDTLQIHKGVDDNQVEREEPIQAEGGEGQVAAAEDANADNRRSDWGFRTTDKLFQKEGASGNKMLAEESSRGGAAGPWPGAGAAAGEGGQEDEHVDVADIDVDGFDGAKNADVRGGGIDAGESGGLQLEKTWEYGPACTSFRRMLNITGAVAALANAAVDVIYAYRTRYVLASMFQLTCVFLVLRAVGTIAAGQYYYTKYVRSYRSSMGDIAEEKNADDDEGLEEEAEGAPEKKSKNYLEGVTLGQHLYSALHLLLYTGFYRLLPSRDFPFELAVGYSLELFLSMVPMLFCIIFNNAETENKTALQSAAMLLKIGSLLALLMELVLMIWEVRLNRRYAKLGFPDSKKLNEEQRRRQWGRKLSWVAVASMGTFILILLIGVVATSARGCGPREALSSATCVPCTDPNCGDCQDGADICLGSCDLGHYLAGSTCARCDGEALDSSAGLACHACTAGADKPVCSKCAPRHGLHGGTCLPCLHSTIRRPYAKLEDSKSCKAPVSPITAATDQECAKQLEQDQDKCATQTGHFTFSARESSRNCGCCDPGAGGKGLQEEVGTNVYRFKDYEDETDEEKDDQVNRSVAAAQSQVYCKSCDGQNTDQCKECSEGSRLLGGLCVPCRENMHHCQKCKDNDSSKCEKCDYQVAELDNNEQCSKCREEGGWYPHASIPGKCTCNGFINVKQNRKCQQCEDLIPGCGECEQTDYPGQQSKVYVGYDSTIANEKKGNYVVCKRCAQDTMFEVTIEKQDGQSFRGCKFCEELVDGCKKCKTKTSSGGVERTVCDQCKRNYYLVQEGDTAKCTPCTEWGQSCQRCNLENGCTDCGAKYWELGGICIKSWF